MSLYMIIRLAALTLLVTGSVEALAQLPPATPKPVPIGSVGAKSSEPDQTTANYSDWALRCVRNGEGHARLCEVMQALGIQGQQQPVARVAIGSPEKPDALRLTLMVPPAISLGEAPQLKLWTKAGGTAVPLAWKRCLPAGCFADGPLGAEVLKLLRERNEPLELTLRDASEQQAAMSISMKGLPQALDALARETLVSR